MSEVPSVALLPRRDPARRFDRRAVAGSILAHLAVLLLLLPFPWARPQEEPEPVPVEVEFVDAPGSSGASGGGAVAETPAPEQAETASAAPAVASPPPPTPRPKPAARPRPKPPVSQPVQRAQVAPFPTEVAPVAPVAPLPPRSPVNAPSVPLPPLPPQAVANTPATGAAGAGPGPASGGGAGRGLQGAGAGSFGDSQGPGDDYLNRVRRWLAKYKKYPPEAMKRKQEGTVLVAFTLARDGTVLSAEIERSSGVPVIDRAVLDMMQRASPVPPVPPQYTGATLSIAMPVRYSIGFFEKLF